MRRSQTLTSSHSKDPGNVQLANDGNSFTVYGITYQLELFRMMAQGSTANRFIFQRRADGHMEVTMETPDAP
jgi:hypothetical protein